MRNASRLLKMLKYWHLKMTEMSYWLRFGFTDNQWENIWQRVRKSSKIGQDQKTLILAFAYILTAIAKNYLWGEDWTTTFASTQFCVFPFFVFLFFLIFNKSCVSEPRSCCQSRWEFQKRFPFCLVDHWSSLHFCNSSSWIDSWINLNNSNRKVRNEIF